MGSSRHWNLLRYLSVILVFAGVVALGVGGYVYSGAYQIGADVPHTLPVYRALEFLRERSIERAAQDISVPALDEPQLLIAGGPDYNEMCASCHLKPGRTESDMSIGLYPAPPDLTSHEDHGEEPGDPEAAARRQFWIIKHGIKASGMPAWGPTHDDQRIWAMVAFLQKLPELSEFQYQILTARGEADSGHAH
ncbi:MAG: cytochrome c [Gammaproteobacteria bacterium]|nr:cytochrome c [Gammaproteobacteria bacterium]